MDFVITMSLIGIVLISVAFGMIIQRNLQDSEEAEAQGDK